MERYVIPETVKRFVRGKGYALPCNDMETHIQAWQDWMFATAPFYRMNGIGADGRRYRVKRRSIRPASRVCREWASLLLNDETSVQCGDEACNEWLADYFNRVNFNAHGQELVQTAFGLGTGAWAVWLDLDAQMMQCRRYGANRMIPLTWDDDGISECAFCTRVVVKGKSYDQVQMHVKGEGGYRILTHILDEGGREVSFDGIVADLATGCPTPTFAVVKPAIANTVVELSPYGMSVFAEAVSAIEGVDLAYDAIFNEIDLSKMRIFIPDSMFGVANQGGKAQPVPFGNDDNVIFRKVDALDSEDITVFAPQLRTQSQVEGYRMALQSLGDLTGFGLKYFDVDSSGGMKTATEVSSDNSALMRNIRKHENLLEGSISQLSHAVLHCARRFLGAQLPEEGEITVQFDDSIITDTAAEKAQDMSELNLTLNPWEYRAKWYNEDEETAQAMVPQSAPAPSFMG